MTWGCLVSSWTAFPASTQVSKLNQTPRPWAHQAARSTTGRVCNQQSMKSVAEVFLCAFSKIITHTIESGFCYLLWGKTLFYWLHNHFSSFSTCFYQRVCVCVCECMLLSVCVCVLYVSVCPSVTCGQIIPWGFKGFLICKGEMGLSDGVLVFTALIATHNMLLFCPQ